MDPPHVLVALVLGVGARAVGLPPLVGFLVAGFVLRAIGVEPGETLQEIAHLGVTLLLFTIGLKLAPRSLLRPQIWGVASAHVALTVAGFGALVVALAAGGLSLFAGMDLFSSLVLAFSLSFSSTVFAIKILEERGDVASLHGRVAVGILIVQDLFAVAFLAVAAGKVPTPFGLGLALALVVFRRQLLWLLEKCGHGELIVLFGVLVALMGSAAFDAVGIKGDLGALFLGTLLAGHAKTDELARALLSFKDLFLVAFFLTIGLSGTPTWEMAGVALLLTALVPLKTALFFWLLTRLRVTSRTSLLVSLGLSNYSEFGLIVGAVAVSAEWLAADWLLVLAMSLSMTFVAAAPLNAAARALYVRWASRLDRFEHPERLPEEQPSDLAGARALVIGLGRVGRTVYDTLVEQFGDDVLGVDSDATVVRDQRAAGRRVILADAVDESLWPTDGSGDEVRVIALTMGHHDANLEVGRRIAERRGDGGTERLALGGVARFPDEARALEEAGFDVVLDVYQDAGVGLGDRLVMRLEEPPVQGTEPETADG